MISECSCIGNLNPILAFKKVNDPHPSRRVLAGTKWIETSSAEGTLTSKVRFIPIKLTWTLWFPGHNLLNSKISTRQKLNENAFFGWRLEHLASENPGSAESDTGLIDDVLQFVFLNDIIEKIEGQD